MQVKFKSPMFLWLKENCGDRSIHTFIVELVQKEMDGSHKGAEDGKEAEGCSSKQLYKNL